MCVGIFPSRVWVCVGFGARAFLLRQVFADRLAVAARLARAAALLPMRPPRKLSPRELSLLEDLRAKAAAGPPKPYSHTNGPLATGQSVRGGQIVPSEWLSCVELKPNAPYRLVVFTWTGNRGGAGCVANLRTKAWALPDFEVWEVVLPGHGIRLGEAARTEPAALIRALAGALFPALAGGKPYCMLGHAFGAVLAWEVAINISARPSPWNGAAEGPALLCVVSAEGPSWPGRGVAQHLGGETRDTCFVNYLGGDDGGRALHSLDDAAFEAMLRRRKGTDEELLNEPDLKEMFMEVIRADIKLEETYAPPRHAVRVGGMPTLVIHGTKPGKDDERTLLKPEAARLWSAATTNKTNSTFLLPNRGSM